jgi:hypothetical protein
VDSNARVVGSSNAGDTTFDPFKDADGARLCVSQTQFKRTGRDVVKAAWDAFTVRTEI